MKRLHPATLLMVLLTLLAIGSCGDDAWSELPGSVFEFVERYYPSTDVESYHQDKNTGVQTVKIKNGATLTFNSENNWININGNGVTLPGMLLYDQLPGPLYSYLKEIEEVGGVFAAKRTSEEYILNLLDSEVTYNFQRGISREFSAP